MAVSSGLFNDALNRETLERRMIGWYVNGDLERIWKEAIVPQPMVLGKICVYMGKKTGFVG
jgi:hypothetical protein